VVAWYNAYKEVEERAAPKARVGGGVARGTWAWYKELGDGSTMREKEEEIRQAHKEVKGAAGEVQQAIKQAKLEQLRAESKRVTSAAATASFASLRTNRPANRRNGGSNDAICRGEGGGGCRRESSDGRKGGG
jgi:hypothetical protein